MPNLQVRVRQEHRMALLLLIPVSARMAPEEVSRDQGLVAGASPRRGPGNRKAEECDAMNIEAASASREGEHTMTNPSTKESTMTKQPDVNEAGTIDQRLDIVEAHILAFLADDSEDELVLID